jgi:hypothetical protein
MLNTIMKYVAYNFSIQFPVWSHPSSLGVVGACLLTCLCVRGLILSFPSVGKHYPARTKYTVVNTSTSGSGAKERVTGKLKRLTAYTTFVCWFGMIQ